MKPGKQTNIQGNQRIIELLEQQNELLTRLLELLGNDAPARTGT